MYFKFLLPIALLAGSVLALPVPTGDTPVPARLDQTGDTPDTQNGAESGTRSPDTPDIESGAESLGTASRTDSDQDTLVGSPSISGYDTPSTISTLEVGEGSGARSATSQSDDDEGSPDDRDPVDGLPPDDRDPVGGLPPDDRDPVDTGVDGNKLAKKLQVVKDAQDADQEEAPVDKEEGK